MKRPPRPAPCTDARAEPSRALARASLAPSWPQGRHVGAQRERQGPVGGPQCAVGNLADEPKRTETTYVRAERVGGVCGARAVTEQVPGAHVGRVVATGRVVKSGT